MTFIISEVTSYFFCYIFSFRNESHECNPHLRGETKKGHKHQEMTIIEDHLRHCLQEFELYLSLWLQSLSSDDMMIVPHRNEWGSFSFFLHHQEFCLLVTFFTEMFETTCPEIFQYITHWHFLPIIQWLFA